MKLYTAFDLHANNIYGAIIGEQGQRVKRQRLASDQEPLAESIRDAKVELLDASFVKAYVDDLKAPSSAKALSWSKSPSFAPLSSGSK